MPEINIEKFLKGLIESAESDNQKVVKTVPMTQPEIAAWKKLRSMREEIRLKSHEADSKKKLFWGKVEERTGVFDKSLRINDETNEIEVMDDAD